MSNVPATGHIKVELLTSGSTEPVAYFEWWMRSQEQPQRLREAAAFLLRLATELENGNAILPPSIG